MGSSEALADFVELFCTREIKKVEEYVIIRVKDEANNIDLDLTNENSFDQNMRRINPDFDETSFTDEENNDELNINFHQENNNEQCWFRLVLTIAQHSVDENKYREFKDTVFKYTYKLFHPNNSEPHLNLDFLVRV